ncbi:MAG: hypothetical protein QM783_01585 [Phycisphaerales bacterium]
MNSVAMLADDGGRKRSDATDHARMDAECSNKSGNRPAVAPSVSQDTGPIRHPYAPFDVEQTIRELSVAADDDTVELLGCLSNFVFEYMDVERVSAPGAERVCGSSQELPNVFGEGHDRQGCLRNTLLAHVNMLKIYRRLGTPFPKGTRKPAPRTRIITIRLSDEEYGWIKEVASVQDKALSNYVREAVVAQAMPAASTVRNAQSMERVAEQIQNTLDEHAQEDGKRKGS